MSRSYPDESIEPQAVSPLEFTDREGRHVEVLPYGDRLDDTAEYEAAVDMYVHFDSSDRAQGIPPSTEERIRSWLDTILGDEMVNVLAWHEDRVVGHATLVPDQRGAHELAIFVQNEYQEAGIGTRLMRTLLWHGAEVGVGRVWLTVERWNTAAINLYEKIGFVASDPEGFELEMSARLASPD